MSKNSAKSGGYTTKAGKSGQDLAAGYFFPYGKPRLANTDSNVVGSVDGELGTGGCVGGLYSKDSHSGLKAGSGSKGK